LPLETRPLGVILKDSMVRLAEWRHKRGHSQRELAKASGVGYVTIARIETGVFDPRLSTLRRLAKALRVQVADLVDE
jgi:transcriptional regulator with XRE-family HTH domain